MHASDQSPEEGVGSHRAEITGCELPDTGAGNQFWSSAKAGSGLDCQVISPAPVRD